MSLRTVGDAVAAGASVGIVLAFAALGHALNRVTAERQEASTDR